MEFSAPAAARRRQEGLEARRKKIAQRESCAKTIRDITARGNCINQKMLMYELVKLRAAIFTFKTCASDNHVRDRAKYLNFEVQRAKTKVHI